MFKRRGNRIKPLLDIKADYVTGNQYPDYLHIAMSNGRVIPYVIDAKPIRIHTGKDGWEKTGTQVIGYKKPQKRVTNLLLRKPKKRFNNDI